MADIVKKPSEAIANPSAEWDPFRAMREFMRWDPFREMMPFSGRGSFAPSFDVTENKDTYVFKADLPGVKQEDIEITTHGNLLKIAGKREYEEEKKTDTVYTYERQYGNFARTFALPEGADVSLAKSELKDGVLSLWIPKKPTVQPKKIEVTSGKPKS